MALFSKPAYYPTIARTLPSPGAFRYSALLPFPPTAKAPIMKHEFTRRQVLTMLAGAGAASVCGITCAPTRPASLLPTLPGEAVALTNVRVVDVAAGRILPSHSVLIESGLIRGVHPDRDPALVQARPIDCRGAYLIPGLINAHCHICSPSFINIGLGDMGAARDQIVQNYADAVAWGVTTVRDMGAMPKMIAQDRVAIERGELLGPHILTAMSIITVPDGYPDFIGDVNWFVGSLMGYPNIRAKNAAQARDAVKRVRDYGADWVKIAMDDRSFVYGRGKLAELSDDQLHAILDEAAKQGLPVGCHHLYGQGLDRALAFGVNSLEHVVMDQPLTDKQLQRTLEAKTPQIPTLSVGVAMAFASPGDPLCDDPQILDILAWKEKALTPQIPLHATPAIAKKQLDIRRFYESGDYTLPENKRLIAFDPQLATRGLLTARANAQRLIAADAPLGIGNDSGVPFDFPGMLHLEMELLVRLGMTPARALRAATLDNAAYCRVADKCGSIAPGKRADLVLLSDDPLADVKNVGRVRAVFKSGDLVAQADGFRLAVMD